MDTKKRMRFAECINGMWKAFCKTAIVDKHEQEIKAYLEANEEAHALLSGLCKEDVATCSYCRGCGEKLAS